jgi:hypothetical protein
MPPHWQTRKRPHASRGSHIHSHPDRSARNQPAEASRGATAATGVTAYEAQLIYGRNWDSDPRDVDSLIQWAGESEDGVEIWADRCVGVSCLLHGSTLRNVFGLTALVLGAWVKQMMNCGCGTPLSTCDFIESYMPGTGTLPILLLLLMLQRSVARVRLT